MFRRNGSPRPVIRRVNPDPNEFEDKRQYSAKTNDSISIDGRYDTEIIGVVLVREGNQVRSKTEFSEFVEQLHDLTYGNEDLYYEFFEDKLTKSELVDVREKQGDSE